jgi:hypothetical protein
MSRHLRAVAIALACLTFSPAQVSGAQPPPLQRGDTIPTLVLSDQEHCQIATRTARASYPILPTSSCTAWWSPGSGATA